MKKKQPFILSLVVLAIAAALIAGWFGWQGRQKAPQQKTVSASSPSASSSAPTQVESETIEEELPPAKVVFKCNDAGKVVYTDAPCPSGPPTDTMILRDAESGPAVEPRTPSTSEQSSTVTGNSALCAQFANEISHLKDWLNQPSDEARKNNWQQRLEDLMAEQQKNGCSS